MTVTEQPENDADSPEHEAVPFKMSTDESINAPESESVDELIVIVAFVVLPPKMLTIELEFETLVA